MKRILVFAFALAVSTASFAQENYKTITKEDSLRTYHGNISYPVKTYPDAPKTKKPKNIIFMIGDGMGTAQIYAGLTANHGHLFLDNFKHVGFSKTRSASDYITDSAAGGTALSSGYRTYNGAIGVDTDTVAHKTMLEIAEDKGKATGLVSTSAITHATPASFIAHQPSRNMYEAIAGDFLKTDIDVFIGGGYKHFTDRKDGKDLTVDLKKKGYTVLQDMNDIEKVKSGKLAGLTAAEHNPVASKRGDMLPRATETALNILSKNKKGFFIMVEGSQIDWGGHQNNTNYVVEEMLDFDQAIGKALEFAAKDGETLIVITADHETGGMAITGGDMETGMVQGSFIYGHHTGVMVPVFAFGPGADEFTGIMKNEDIGKKLIQLVSGNE
ncbi:alkaline phosphatase [Mangrovibacterium diazotrophicum]|uniref:Alkaline phosphatase n=1 Tax=Mangrovibacterium diazotrophicum TaxID=1261403 RepID=A0A419VVT6_9BACT|nr:alkaline phosphatase [Mangrovibacterium diazotrophicum]RKD86102.1 alkaline phosphatase [Mangrovibacterium diazotrophicum]